MQFSRRAAGQRALLDDPAAVEDDDAVGLPRTVLRRGVVAPPCTPVVCRWPFPANTLEVALGASGEELAQVGSVRRPLSAGESATDLGDICHETVYERPGIQPIGTSPSVRRALAAYRSQ